MKMNSPFEKKITSFKKNKQIDTKLRKFAFIDTPREETVKLKQFGFMDEPVITSYAQHKFKQLFGEDFVEDTIGDIYDDDGDDIYEDIMNALGD